MSTYTSRVKKAADRTDVQLNLPSDVLYLGADGASAEHYYSRIADAVVVVDETGTVEQREHLDECSLENWIDYVETERGWETLNYADSIGKALGLEVA